MARVTNSLVPVPKVIASTVAGAVTVILVWILGELGVDVPAEVGSSITVVFSAIAGYFAPRSTTEP